MTIKKTLAAAVFAVATAAPALAVTVDVDFTFSGVTGTFYDIDTADGVNSASKYDFDGLYYTYQDLPVPALRNKFTFSDGKLVSVDFYDPTVHASFFGPMLLTFSIAGDYDDGFDGNSVELSTTFAVGSSSGAATLSGVAIYTPPVPVPLSASALFLLSGFAGVVVFKRLRKKAP